jgi:ribose 5-phosphate isomerase A
MNNLKLDAAMSACKLIKDGQIVGLGTGSTVSYVLQEIGNRIKENELRIQGIPTSKATQELAQKMNIPLTTLEEHYDVDIAIDGADQVSSSLDLIKGGGGAHTREKIVAKQARKFVIIVDDGKLSEKLDIPVPIEILPFSRKVTSEILSTMSIKHSLRGLETNPLITDNGNYILDVDFGEIKVPGDLESKINSVIGVVENGIFSKMADEVHVASAKGINILKKG